MQKSTNVVKLVRKGFTPNSTLGFVYINDKFFCHSLEDKDRLLTDSMPLMIIKGIKVFGLTAIPKGIYFCDFRLMKSQNVYHYAINNVKGFTGVFIHSGNYAKDTKGCPLLGVYLSNWSQNDKEFSIVSSRLTVRKFEAELKGEPFTLIIE